MKQQRASLAGGMTRRTRSQGPLLPPLQLCSWSLSCGCCLVHVSSALRRPAVCLRVRGFSGGLTFEEFGMLADYLYQMCEDLLPCERFVVDGKERRGHTHTQDRRSSSGTVPPPPPGWEQTKG